MGEQLVGYSVECAVCHQTKGPRGRSVPMMLSNARCGYDCPGYTQPPLVGDLWPGETAEDFGYPLPPHPGERTPTTEGSDHTATGREGGE